MSKKKFIEFRDDGFWTYDVSLGVFLKHLVDVALPRSEFADTAWLADAIEDWRQVAVIPDIGLEVNASWSADQLGMVVDLVEEACTALAARETYTADEITSWVLFRDFRIFPRGHCEVWTAPVIELGRAVIALIDGTLTAAPDGRHWLFGAPQGRIAI